MDSTSEKPKDLAKQEQEQSDLYLVPILFY